MNPFELIFNRMKEESPCFVEIFAGDDKKKEKKIYSQCFDLNKSSIEDIKTQIDTYNIGSYGVFMNFNPLRQNRRLKDNISKIKFIFIDLDDANETHNDLIKETLDKWKIKYSYNAQSGHGYHFLIPIELESKEELKVKAFLTYLKENVCSKVDVATYTNERLLRCPESIHKKDDIEKELKTLFCSETSKQQIKKNTENFVKYQTESKKGKVDLVYLDSIKREDVFFSKILNSKDKWKEYYKYLNNSEDRNDIFVKNLGFFVSKDDLKKEMAKAFLVGWEKSRIGALEGWIKKARQYDTNVLYYELLKWAKKHKSKEFIKLLQEQTKETLFDKYEIYFLDDEKKENAYLLYYPEKNYFVQKSFHEVLITIYYDCKEQGIDLITYFGLDQWDKWDGLSFRKQQIILYDTLHKKLDTQNRIKKIHNINYEPSDNKFIYLDNRKYFNIYTKTELWDLQPKKEINGFPHIKELIMNLVGDDEKSYNYFNKWLGWQLQNPTKKLPTAVIFQGRQGSGKGTLLDLVLSNIFGDNVQEINQTHLESSFNEYLMGKQMIIANEVMHNENRQTLPNVLKNLVTDSVITISRKFKKEIKCNNYTHWIFCTNSDNPIKIEDDDRRYSVFYSEKLKGGGKKAYKFRQDLMKNLDYELKQYVSHLKNLKIESFEVYQPIFTKAKQEIIDLNKDTIVKFLEDLPKYENINDMFIKIFGNDKELHYIGDGFISIDTDCLYRAYVEWCNKLHYKGVFQKQNFSKKLSTLGIISFPRKHKVNEKWISVRTYSVDNIEKFMEIENG